MKRLAQDFQQIPEKVYFRIGEVSILVGVDPHVLRYWESEFSVIRPFRGKSKQRLYRRQDVENLLFIKTLLHDEGYTISGARKLLKGTLKQQRAQLIEHKEHPHDEADAQLLQYIKSDLHNILDLLIGSMK